MKTANASSRVEHASSHLNPMRRLSGTGDTISFRLASKSTLALDAVETHLVGAEAHLFDLLAAEKLAKTIDLSADISESNNWRGGRDLNPRPPA